MDNYVKVLIHRMARASRTELTPRHEAILEYACQYYERNRVGPLYYNLKRHLGATREEINRLFPYGLNSVYSWVGIPIRTTDQTCKPVINLAVQDAREVYLDHNATTYLRPEVSRTLVDYDSGRLGFANPSSSTQQGKRAYEQIQEARRTVAECLGVEPEEFIFTGGGSEANSLAIKGIAFRHLERRGRIITSSTEHSSVLETMKFLESLGFAVTYLPVEKDGRVEPGRLAEALSETALLVSIMAVNNEIGMIHPLRELGAICRERNVPFMVDAIQGFGKIPLKPRELGISLLTVSGHKIYAPKGIGGLYVDRGIRLVPLVHGKEQEFGLRGGTENVGHIMAMGQASRLACEEMDSERRRLLSLRDYFLSRLQEIEPGYLLNGSLENRMPHNLSVRFPQVDTSALLLSLNAIGICVSSGSACSSGRTETSHVLRAIGADTPGYGKIRFSFGRKTDREDLDYLFTYLPEILSQIKEPKR